MEGREERGKRNDRNGGRFAAIALPRSYRPEPPDSILLVPHIPMYTYTRTCFTYYSPREYTNLSLFLSLSLFLPFINSSRDVASYFAFGLLVQCTGIVSRCSRLESTYNTTISTPVDSYTGCGIHYTSDFLSISCGTPRNLRIGHC